MIERNVIRKSTRKRPLMLGRFPQDPERLNESSGVFAVGHVADDS